MARKADYSNTQKYRNRKSFDGQPVPTGKVLVPFRIDLYNLKKNNYIDANCTTMHLIGFLIKVVKDLIAFIDHFQSACDKIYIIFYL